MRRRGVYFALSGMSIFPPDLSEVIDMVRRRKNGNERGASLVEYAITIAIISFISIASVRTVGQKVSKSMNLVTACVGGSTTDCDEGTSSYSPY